MKCTRCHSQSYHKAGRVNDKQRYKCKDCHYYYTVERKSTKKPDNIKRLAIHMYLEGIGFRAIGRILNISYGTVYQWVKKLGEHTDLSSNNPSIVVMELDEIHSYVHSKKNTFGHGLLLIDIENGSSTLFADEETQKRLNAYTVS